MMEPDPIVMWTEHVRVPFCIGLQATRIFESPLSRFRELPEEIRLPSYLSKR